MATTDHEMRSHYLGLLGLLAECSVYIRRNGPEGEELWETIGDALEDARRFVPTIRVRRILDRYELEVL